MGTWAECIPSALRRCTPSVCRAYISGIALVPMLQLLHVTLSKTVKILTLLTDADQLTTAWTQQIFLAQDLL